MKAYVATTGVLFLALAAAHVLRVLNEHHLARDPWFVISTVIAVSLSGWALRLYRTKEMSS